jgi:hypothetical protein
MQMKNKDQLEKELTEMLNEIMTLINDYKWDPIAKKDLWNKMVDTAYELHKIVKPKHHKYMIENRGFQPDTREFYDHIHPVEDLLAYLKDPHANDDPEDQTLDCDFKIKIFTRRWGHYDTYQIKRISTGWYVGHLALSGNCDKSGKPYLIENLRHDSVNYPEALPGYLEWLWDQAAELGLTPNQVQDCLNELGEWITSCEESSPKGIWEAYK